MVMETPPTTHPSPQSPNIAIIRDRHVVTLIEDAEQKESAHVVSSDIPAPGVVLVFKNATLQ